MARLITDSSARTRRGTRTALLLTLAVAVAPVTACGGQDEDTSTQVATVPGINAKTTDGSIKLLNLTIAYPESGEGRYPSGVPIPLNVRIFNDGARTAQLTGVTVEGSSAGTAAVTVVEAPVPPAPTASPTPSGSAPAGSPSAGRSGRASTASQGPGRSAAPSRTASAAGAVSPGAVASGAVPSSQDPAAPSGSASPSGSAAAGAVAVPVPAGQLVVLAPGSSRYLAIMNLATDLRAGGTVRLTFTFSYDDGSTTSAAHLNVPMAPPAEALPRQSAVSPIE